MKHLHKEILPILSQYANGVSRWQTPAVKLFQLGLLEEDGPYALKLSLKGKMALNGVHEDVWFRVNESHHLPLLRGKVGRVTSIRPGFLDANGVDEYGYDVLRAKSVITVTGRFPDLSGEWCFYNPEDLVGFPHFE